MMKLALSRKSIKRSHEQTCNMSFDFFLFGQHQIVKYTVYPRSLGHLYIVNKTMENGQDFPAILYV